MQVFISSTYDDLVEHRAIIGASFLMSGIQYNDMEHFGSSTGPTIQTCLDAVSSSNVFVGVLGIRYGSSPPGLVQSYTEREYHHARRLAQTNGMPILMFIMDEERASVPALYVDLETPEQRERLRKFKDLVMRKHTVSFFKTPEDLARLVLASIIKEKGVLP